MMKNKDSIFVDTSGFKALIDEKDEFHKEAVNIWKNLSQTDVLIVTTNYILDETFTLLRAKCGIGFVLEFRTYLIKSAPIIKLERVTSKDEANAWNWFAKDWSKLSFTDCVSFALMNRLNIKKTFTFDKHFAKAGFLLER